MTDAQQFCDQCGAGLTPGATFCESCGHAVAPEAPVEVATPVAAPVPDAAAAAAVPVSAAPAAPAAPVAAAATGDTEAAGGRSRFAWPPIAIGLVGVLLIIAAIVSSL